MAVDGEGGRPLRVRAAAQPDDLRVRDDARRAGPGRAGPTSHTIAEAKVETSYARVRLGGDRLDEVGTATRRLRVSLLRLAVPAARPRKRAPLAPAALGPARATARPTASSPRPRPAPPRRGAARGARSGCAPAGRPARRGTRRPRSRTGANENVQNRLSGRSNRVSSTTLNTPSWPTRIDHGCPSSVPDAAVAADLRPVEAAARVVAPEPLEDRRRAPAARAPGPRPATRRPAPTDSCGPAPPAGELAGPSGARSRRGSRPPTRPARSRGSRAPGARRTLAADRGRRHGAPRSRSCGRAGSGRSRSGRPPGTGSSGRRVRAPRAAGRERRLPPARRRTAASRPGPGTGPRGSTRTRRAGAGRASRRGPRGSAACRSAGPAGSAVGHRSPPRRIVQTSITASSARIASATGGGHLVVEREHHERVGARRGAGQRHRRDVDVRLAEQDADPAHRARACPGGG